jgi:hypothetical protein
VSFAQPSEQAKKKGKKGKKKKRKKKLQNDLPGPFFALIGSGASMNSSSASIRPQAPAYIAH